MAVLIVVSGVLAGIGAGLKLSGLPIALGVAIAHPLAAKGAVRRLSHGLYAGCGIVAGLLISYGWWGYELASRYGNPVLPYLNQLFHSPYAPWLFNNDTRRQPHGIVDILFYPIIWTQYPRRVGPIIFLEASLPFLEVVLLALILLSGIFALSTRTRFALFDNKRQRYLMLVIVVSYFLWVIEFGIYRYLIPIDMLSFIASTGLPPSDDTTNSVAGTGRARKTLGRLRLGHDRVPFAGHRKHGELGAQSVDPALFQRRYSVAVDGSTVRLPHAR